MTFILEQFLKLNLIQGFQNGSFNENQVNIFSINYLNKGQITEEIFADIQAEIIEIKREWEEAEKNPPVIEPELEEPTVEPEMPVDETVDDLPEEPIETLETPEEEQITEEEQAEEPADE